MAYGLGLVIDLLIVTYIPDLSGEGPDGQGLADGVRGVVVAIKLMLGIVCCYLAISFVLQTKDDIRFVIPYVEFTKQSRGARPLILDTSVIIDGRIADICETRIIDSPLMIPRFVLQELQSIADSSDKLKRNRGRRGLDIVNKLQANEKLELQFLDTPPDREEAYEAVDHLLQAGHQRIGCIQRLPHSWISNERVRGYRDAHAKHGLAVDERLIVGDLYGQRNGYLETKRLLQMDPAPTAIFALSHLVTLGVLRALREHRLTLPGQMALVGFDDLPNVDYFDCPVTTVRQPIEEMASLAVSLLLEQIESEGNVRPVMIKLPTELVRRRSV